MFKLITILLIGLVLEAVGVVFLSQGLHEIGAAQRLTTFEIGRLIARGATNGRILSGLACEAAFFGVLLYLLSQRDVSLIWPLTSLGFLITAAAAKFIRHEDISTLRWSGVVLIVVGAMLVAWSERLKTPSPGAGAVSSSAAGSAGAERAE